MPSCESVLAVWLTLVAVPRAKWPCGLGSRQGVESATTSLGVVEHPLLLSTDTPRMANPAETTRRVEVHFALEDEALIIDVEDGDASAVDDLLKALDAADVDEAEGLLREKALSANRMRPRSR
jgi:hypothetical protein